MLTLIKNKIVVAILILDKQTSEEGKFLGRKKTII